MHTFVSKRIILEIYNLTFFYYNGHKSCRNVTSTISNICPDFYRHATIGDVYNCGIELDWIKGKGNTWPIHPYPPYALGSMLISTVLDLFFSSSCSPCFQDGFLLQNTPAKLTPLVFSILCFSGISCFCMHASFIRDVKRIEWLAIVLNFGAKFLKFNGLTYLQYFQGEGEKWTRKEYRNRPYK